MKSKKLINSVLSLVVVTVATTGVVYAILAVQATLKGNTISASPGLQLSVDGSTYGTSITGSAFDITPGDTLGVTKTFKLKNKTNQPLAITFKLTSPVTFTGGTVDQTKVHELLSCDTTLNASTTFEDLASQNVAAGNIPANTVVDCNMTTTMDSEAITSGIDVQSSAFDLRFDGVQ